MNLVAKEFIATRLDEGGALVLSEFAGVANELSEAIHVNPYDLDESANAFFRALTMPQDEMRTRMRAAKTGFVLRRPPVGPRISIPFGGNRERKQR